MQKSDKVIQAIPLTKMIKRSDDVKFEVISKNGFYASILGQIIMEFDSIQDANKTVEELNRAVSSVLELFKKKYESKLEAILA